MLSGLYGFIFGAEDAAAKVSCFLARGVPGPGVADCRPTETSRGRRVASRGRRSVSSRFVISRNAEAQASGRSSPVLVASPQLVDMDSLSVGAAKQPEPPSPAALRRAEALRQARAATAQRQRVEKELFASSSDSSPSPSPSASSSSVASKAKAQLSASRLKRASVVGHVQAESKTPSRSKKAGRLASGRNNDRKVNNIA